MQSKLPNLSNKIYSRLNVLNHELLNQSINQSISQSVSQSNKYLMCIQKLMSSELSLQQKTGN